MLSLEDFALSILQKIIQFKIDGMLTLPERHKNGILFNKSYKDIDFGNISDEDKWLFTTEVTYAPINQLDDYFQFEMAEFTTEFDYVFEEEFITKLVEKLNERSRAKNKCAEYTLENCKIIQTYKFPFLTRPEIRQLEIHLAISIYLLPIYEEKILELADNYLVQLFLTDLK